MTAMRLIPIVLSLLALLLGAGCIKEDRERLDPGHFRAKHYCGTNDGKPFYVTLVFDRPDRYGGVKPFCFDYDVFYGDNTNGMHAEASYELLDINTNAIVDPEFITVWTTNNQQTTVQFGKTDPEILGDLPVNPYALKATIELLVETAIVETMGTNGTDLKRQYVK